MRQRNTGPIDAVTHSPVTSPVRSMPPGRVVRTHEESRTTCLLASEHALLVDRLMNEEERGRAHKGLYQLRPGVSLPP